MIDANAVVGSHNFLFITLDSLRYDVARAAMATGATPALADLAPDGRWEERRTLGTFTFPAHQAFFAGFFPKGATPDQPTRLFECRPPVGKPVRPQTFIVDHCNIVGGLADLDYRTVCIGGVTYFSSETPLGSVFPAMFAESYWSPDYGSPCPISARRQVDQALTLLTSHDPGRPIFLFLNISATHVPHRHYVSDKHPADDWNSQFAALMYADTELRRLLDHLPSYGPWLIVICSDHGEAFGEDGYTGHGVAHPVVWAVPYLQTLLD